MAMRISQGEAKYLKELFSFHSAMGKAMADLTFAIASGSEPDVEKAHAALAMIAIEIENAVEHYYPHKVVKGKPGPKRGVSPQRKDCRNDRTIRIATGSRESTSVDGNIIGRFHDYLLLSIPCRKKTTSSDQHT